MENCAVITEYNPFHTGHKYQLDVLRTQGFKNIVCVMSGPFVQSGMPAFCDKALRAECAVMGGADAVIELPVVYATAGAQVFAEGGAKIISGIKGLTHLAMGAFGTGDDINRLAEIKIKHADSFTKALKRALERGKSYNAATALALTEMYGKLYPDRPAVSPILEDPNSILCIEYICAINKYCANIQPLIVPRVGARYNDMDTDRTFASATAIREAYERNEQLSVKKFIPYNADKINKQRIEHAADIDLYKKLALFALKRAQVDEIKCLRDCSEGMEYLLKNASHMNDLDEIVTSTTCRRYSKKRIYRLLLALLLGIDKSLTDKPFCTRLLSCKNDFDFSILPPCVKTNNADIKAAAAANSDIISVLRADMNATALYNTLSHIIGDYFNYSLIKL